MWFKPKNRPLEARLPGEVEEDGRVDEYSPTWIFIRRWAESELFKAREQNDFQKTTELKTAALRGRIKLLKELLTLPGGR